jgi:hypothetical protein
MNTTKKPMNQHDLIAQHLKSKQPITSMEAFKKYKCTRLSAVIYNLIYNRGMKIKRLDVKSKTGTRYGVYYIGKKPVL